MHTSHLVRKPRPLGWLLALLVLTAAAPATAQQVMVNGNGSTLYDLATGAVRWTSSENLAFYGAQVSATGQFAVGVHLPGPTIDDRAVRVTDMSTGAHVEVPMSFEPRAADPRALVFYGLSGGPISLGFMQGGTAARLDAGGLVLYGGCPPLQTVSIRLSGDGTRVFALCESGLIVSIDTVTGTATDTLLNIGRRTFASNYDGTALLIATNAGTPLVQLVDVATAAVLASSGPIGAYDVTIGAMSPDRTLAIIYRVSNSFPLPHHDSVVLDLGTFTLGPTLAGNDLQIASISPDNRTSYSVSTPRFGTATAQTHDLATGAVTASVSNAGWALVISHAPLPPVGTAAVSGHRVDLSWTAQRGSPAATEYVLEVGSRPGASDLATVTLGPQPTLSVPVVPTGRYYVRVRARNVAGVSGASNELVLDVP